MGWFKDMKVPLRHWWVCGHCWGFSIDLMSLTLAWHQGKMNHRVFSRLKLALLHRRFMFVWSLSVWTLKAQSDVWTDEALEVLHPSLKRTITIFKREKLWLRLTEGPVVFSRQQLLGSSTDLLAIQIRALLLPVPHGFDLEVQQQTCATEEVVGG